MAGGGTNPLGSRPSPLRIRAGNVIVGAGAGAIILGRPGNLISGRRTVNFNYTRTFKKISILG